MLMAIRRWWRYLGTKIGAAPDEVTGPKVRLEQAIAEAREQHQLLTEQAANILANQSQLQARLDRTLEEYERVMASAGQAVVLADRAERAADQTTASGLTQAAHGLVARQIGLEREIDSLKRLLLEATAASDQAKRAVQVSSASLQRKLAQREALLSRLDQAEMQEQMNAAMRQLAAPVGGDIPTFDEVRDTIDRRLATAQAMAEVRGTSLDVQMLEVEELARHAETAARLDNLRTHLGISVTNVERPSLPDPTATSGQGADPS